MTAFSPDMWPVVWLVVAFLIGSWLVQRNGRG
jgi:hypothetical protein